MCEENDFFCGLGVSETGFFEYEKALNLFFLKREKIIIRHILMILSRLEIYGHNELQ